MRRQNINNRHLAYISDIKKEFLSAYWSKRSLPDISRGEKRQYNLATFFKISSPFLSTLSKVTNVQRSGQHKYRRDHRYSKQSQPNY